MSEKGPSLEKNSDFAVFTQNSKNSKTNGNPDNTNNLLRAICKLDFSSQQECIKLNKSGLKA